MHPPALHYTDPRLVVLYDTDNPRGTDTDFFLSLAKEIQAQTIIDLGCGTGLLTREFAQFGERTVFGVDPAAAMLGIAQSHPGAERVRWVHGDSSTIGQLNADLAVMTGNVAQIFLDDADWNATLRDLHAALRPGGVLAFESRNPADRAWERWTPEATFERIDSPNGPMECWLEVLSVANDRVRMVGHNVFLDTGETLTVSDELRFRSQAEISASLRNVGFDVVHVYGDWQRGPVTDASRVMVFVAQRPV